MQIREIMIIRYLHVCANCLIGVGDVVCICEHCDTLPQAARFIPSMHIYYIIILLAWQIKVVSSVSCAVSESVLFGGNGNFGNFQSEIHSKLRYAEVRLLLLLLVLHNSLSYCRSGQHHIAVCAHF